MKPLTAKEASIGLLLIPPFAYFLFFLHHAINVPVGDDFVVIIKFLLDWDGADSLEKKGSLLVQNFIEHRLVYTRLSALLVRFSLDKLDLRAVMFLGNITLLGLFWLLTRPLVKAKLPLWYCLPLSLLIFQPIAYEGNFWAIASTNYMPVCFFSLLSIYLLSSQQPIRQFLAVIIALVATLTFANGLLVWPIGAILLILQYRLRSLVAWVLISVITVSLYFYGFCYDNRPDLLYNLFHKFRPVISTFFLMIGAFINPYDKNHSFRPMDYFQLATGLILGGWLLYSLARLSLRTSIFALNKKINAGDYPDVDYLIGIGLFLLASCVLFALGRSIEGSVVTESRYRHFSVFLVALGYIFLLLFTPGIHRRKIFLISLLGSFLFCINSYIVYTPKLENMQRRLKAGVYNWNHNHRWLIYEQGGYFKMVANTMSNQIEQHAQNWYRFPTYFPTLSLTTPMGTDNLIRVNSSSSPTDQTILVNYFNQSSGEPYVFLINQNSVWCLEACRPTSIRNLLLHGNYQTSYIQNTFSFPTGTNHVIPVGQYQIGIVFINNNQPTRTILKPGFTVSIR